jgi:alcohol dehydrogenase (cytochrome c)
MFRNYLAACLLFNSALFGEASAAYQEPVPVGAEWEGYNKSLNGQRYSPLDQINAANAASLVEVCRVRVASGGSFQAGLVVTGGSIFASTATETMALDSTTCRVKWHHSYHRAQEPGFPSNRGVAVLNGRVFRGTDDGRLLALDANTGQEIWISVVGDPAVGEYVVAAPVAWNGLVMIGIAGGEFGIRGRILAYDALTGREVWRFNTIPVGKEFGAETWSDRKWSQLGGGGTWSTFTLDPRTAEVFAPIGNPAPDFAATDRAGANLFTNSVLVLDARSGELRWWYQLQPNDDHDHDLAAAPLLFQNSAHEKMMAAAGKDGLLHIVERESHRARFKVPVTTVDLERKKVTPAGVKVCPGSSGGVLWNGPAYDPTRKTLFVGAVDLCLILSSKPGTSPVPRGLNLGGGFKGAGDLPSGWVTAVNADTGAIRWKYRSDTPVVAGVTPTGGGIVMTGDGAGNFLVFESDSGKLLRKEASGGGMYGGVVTYWQAGKQYVAFTSGNVSPTSFGSIGRPTVVVMSLPGTPTSATTSNVPDAARGKQLFQQICAGCHGPEGDRIAGKELKSAARRLNPGELADFIRNPKPPMPKVFPEPRSADDERDVRDVAAFVGIWSR